MTETSAVGIRMRPRSRVTCLASDGRGGRLHFNGSRSTHPTLIAETRYMEECYPPKLERSNSEIDDADVEAVFDPKHMVDHQHR